MQLEHKAARKLLGTRQTQARGIRYKGDVSDLDAPASGVSLAVLLKATRRDLLGARDRALEPLLLDRLQHVVDRVEVEGLDEPHPVGQMREPAAQVVADRAAPDAGRSPLDDAGADAADGNIEKISMDERDGRISVVQLVVSVHDRVHLARVIKKLRTIKGVTRITRVKA